MADTRYSREDLTSADFERVAGVVADRLAAGLRMTPTPEPGAPQQDGPTSRPSAPADGARRERGWDREPPHRPWPASETRRPHDPA